MFNPVFSRKKIFLFHLLFFLLLVSAFIWSKSFYWILISFNAVFFFYFLRFKKIIAEKKDYLFFILPGLFINSLAFYLSLLISKFYIILFLIVGLMVSFYYFSGLKKRVFRKNVLGSDSLSIWSDVLSLLFLFLTASFFYGLTYFLNINNWVLFVFISLMLLVSSWQNIFLAKESFKTTIFFGSLFLFSVLPLVWILFFLPFNYNILGLLLSLCYYLGLSLIRFYLTKGLTIKKIKYNLIFIISLLIIILLLVKWR
ncbi:MAG TPA: hypothetical protein PK142_00390 [bacterium]|nr:hypothetical protein [bacterium]